MRIAVMGDLHANLPALHAVIDDAARIGADAGELARGVLTLTS